MATAGGKNGDFYAVLGLNRECSGTELRNAYKKLALRWHPDRCSAAGKSEFAKEAKEKFQAIQEAYSILSDSNKRFLYDVGVYDRDDDDETEMGNFLDEMVQMMSQTKHNESSLDSFEDLQQLFVEMVEADIDLSGFGCGPVRGPNPSPDSAKSGKRRGPFTASASGKARLEELNPGSAGFRFGPQFHLSQRRTCCFVSFFAPKTQFHLCCHTEVAISSPASRFGCHHHSFTAIVTILSHYPLLPRF